MTKPSLRLSRFLVPAFLAGMIAGPAGAQEKVTFAYLLDPSYEAVLYGMKSGKVKSDKIVVETRALAIPALLQATSAKQFDVVMTAVIGVPRAIAQGLPLSIMATGLRYHASGEGADIWVKNDSPIRTVADLKGKTLGVYGINSTGITLIRLALWKKYNMNVAIDGGDFRFVEVPAPSLPAALATDRIDAATLIHSQAYQASQKGEFRSIVRTAADMMEVFGLRMVSAVMVGYPERLEARPVAFREFARMLKETAAYALEHQDEVFPAIARQANIEPGFFTTWFTRYSDAPGAITAQDITAINKVWELSKELGLIQDYPDANGVIWRHAIRE
ncbi:MAG: ABC transporter substrate-binding protein [Pseudomonadota bacterium]